ncbi:CCA tRNA nucleotidyltransferase [Desertifilum sp. FACHB-1129]|uniref:[cytidine(C)-cytidine(C)-adenosine (A)]-adding enzyme n=2 Tax=Desertifilaceae TaxID=1969992 RepID=A0A1E5QDK0_9CYAN|nr:MULTISPECIES: CCA tRNA nucleotidyltransferase [unclassified Desertifilum]MDA0213668.1 CCA tRNA nucleotidyltransferase [Cyanobacteria bacterium FC1]OEJ72750.1 hypothetical protein BH720_23280 [Desertifilum tharense IPPAS B-1220]MBD2312858.1 CCA tRNA nucleotidyltransferase [Desertifilum sp. FACHB-1129]MBD2325231.1 CCA tRNA nucleotidyltransferase [Desertifilum sp. FACHB-866]MBD2335339.1 CCA tRNA nucleotidyltransferase [Desertifilum sp. FACHB-868]
MRDRILESKNWPFSLDCLPHEAYLVGGAVRDALLDRDREYLDLDFVMPFQSVQTARAIAQRYNAGFVVLDPERQIARVVFENATVDLALQEGESLETDLRRRDFTMNAIAYNPRTGEFIDPLQGRQDLDCGTIRQVSLKNLQDDPLRLVRAYRQAAQLQFTIEPQTRDSIRTLAPLLTRVAAERIQTELSYWLNTPGGSEQLQAALADGLLKWILHDGVSQKAIAQVSQIDSLVAELAETSPPLAQELQHSVPGLASGSKRTLTAITKLAILLNPYPNPGLQYTRLNSTVEKASVEEFMAQMKYSNAEIRAVTTALKYSPQLQIPNRSIREQYFFFQSVGDLFAIVVLFTLAQGIPLEQLSPDIQRYLNPQDPVAHPVSLVTGTDLIQSLNLKPSPLLGKLLTEIQIAQAEGKISTRQDALDLAQSLA